MFGTPPTPEASKLVVATLCVCVPGRCARCGGLALRDPRPRRGTALRSSHLVDGMRGAREDAVSDQAGLQAGQDQLLFICSPLSHPIPAFTLKDVVKLLCETFFRT